jgi:WD40 repeat protein
MMKRLTFLTLSLCAFSTAALAQTEALPLLQDDVSQTLPVSDDSGKQHDYPQAVTPQGLESYEFSTYFYNNKQVYNLLGLKMSSGKTVKAFRVSPDGKTYAVASSDGKGGQVMVYDLWKRGKSLQKIDFKQMEPVALAYNADGTQLAVALTSNNVVVFDVATGKDLVNIMTNTVINQLEYSPDGLYLALADENSVDIRSVGEYTRRQLLQFASKVNDIEFSPDKTQLAVLTSEGRLVNYDTTTFSERKSFDALGEARSVNFHQDGKYVAVVTGDQRIAVINMLNDQDRQYIDNEKGGVNSLKFLRDGKMETYLAYNTSGSIVYEYMDQLAPYHQRLLADQLNERMAEWMQQQPDETLAAYQARISNEELKAEQMRLFERELTTAMAGNLTDNAELSLGDYSERDHLLELNFADEALPTIYVSVPREEVGDFADLGALEIRNPVYALNDKDEFELIYADVYNTRTGKSYPFNNLEHKSLDYLKDDSSFLPLDVINQSNAEQQQLMTLRDDVMTNAMAAKQLTDNTDISVGTATEVVTDAMGQTHRNYKVSFGYKTQQAFSGKEDFASGQYKTEQSKAAMSMLKIIEQALKEDLKQYVKAGKTVNIAITGMADAQPIYGSIKYDGCYGEPQGFKAKLGGKEILLDVNKRQGIATNEQLALIRGLGVKNYIEKNVTDLKQMNRDYEQIIELSEETGGQFRRITVVFTFVDAFN